MTQEDALKILKAGRNVYLTGPAGSGKTHVLNEYIQYLRDRDVFPAITASTGIAATHLRGQTIHSWSGIGIKEYLTDYDIDLLTQKENLFKRYERTNVLIIDEVSMLSPQFFDSLNMLAKAMRGNEEPFGGMQIVLSGDFFQLPPIQKGEIDVRYVDSSDGWKEMDVRVCYLETQYRADDVDLESILNEIRTGIISTQTKELFESIRGIRRPLGVTPTRLYTHNADVDSVNETELDKIDEQLEVFEMRSSGNKARVEGLKNSVLAPEILKLKVGAVVMFVKNSFEEGYVNGTLGEVVEFDGGQPVVKTFSGKTIYVTKEDWEFEEDGKVKAKVSQLPLRLAWAITVHKSQGMSLDAAEIDLSKAFVSGQGYVALSRLRSLEGLILLGLNSMALTVDPYVLELDRYLLRESAKWTKVIGRFTDEQITGMHKVFIEKCGGTNDPKKIEQNQKEIEQETLRQAQGKKQKVPSHEKTFALIQEGKSLEEIATVRGLKLTTVIDHLEKLHTGEYDLDLKAYKPKATDLKIIKSAFKVSPDKKLTPVYKKLKGKYSFDELRLARLFV